jgi:cohesin domain-containing protein
MRGGDAMNRRPARIIVMILTTAAGLLTGTVGQAAQATLGCPARVHAGRQLATVLTIDVGTAPLGAYSVTVVYDPAVLTIASVAGGSAEFAGAPTTNPESFTTGATIIAGLQSSSLTAPTGVVDVARVTFDARAAATTTAIGVMVRSLFDTRSTPISSTATGCTVVVKAPSATKPAEATRDGRASG